MKIGDLISFKPKYYSHQDWSGPSIVIDSYVGEDSDETMWIVWCDGGKYMVNLRNDDVVHLTCS